MPGLSASQEMQLEYVIWRPPESLPIEIRRRAMDGIHEEVNEAFAAAPHRGVESGGILLGRREPSYIVIEDFEPVPCEHRFGPSYRLSDKDRELLQETLAWFRGGAQPGLSVLGLYRSHSLPDAESSADDEDLMRADFAPNEDLVLLVKPRLMGSSDQDFSIRRCGRAPASAPATPPPLMDWPAPRPRQAVSEPEPARPRRRWPWYTVALLVGLICGALGYLWWHPETGVEQIALSPPAAPAAQPIAAQPIVEGSPVPAATDTAGINDLLDRWAGALKRGDFDAAAQCYVPLVGTYFTRHNVTREAIRQSIQQARSRYGRLDVYRIMGLGLTPVSDDRAVATFRKLWRTSGRGRSSGEEEERMTLVRLDGGWKISSESAK